MVADAGEGEGRRAADADAGAGDQNGAFSHRILLRNRSRRANEFAQPADERSLCSTAALLGT
jgi:hypothetical protein